MNFAVNWGFNLNINENLPLEKAKNVVQGWNWDIWLACAVVRKRRHRFEILLINFGFWEMISGLLQGEIKDIHGWSVFLADNWRHLATLAAMNDCKLLVLGEPNLTFAGFKRILTSSSTAWSWWAFAYLKAQRVFSGEKPPRWPVTTIYFESVKRFLKLCFSS